MSAADLRAMLVARHVTHVPGVYDPASAALAVRAGHRAVHLSGAAIATTMLGRPDLDFTPATQIADRAAIVVPVLGGVPLLADANIGYDDPDHAVWTALAYQRAGISGLRLDDIDDADLSAARITALVRQVPGMALIAQAGGEGLAETIRRSRAYARAGAEAILPAGIHEADDLEQLRAAVPGVPLVVSRSETVTGGRWPTDAKLAALSVRLVLHPLAAVLAATRAASVTYRAIAEQGDAEEVDRMPLAAFAAVASARAPRASGASRAPRASGTPGTSGTSRTSGTPTSRTSGASPTSGTSGDSAASPASGPWPVSGASPASRVSWASGLERPAEPAGFETDKINT